MRNENPPNGERLELAEKGDLDLYEWTLLARTIEGEPFSFEGHAYLEAVFRDDSDRMVIRKASQMAGTEFGISKAIYLADSHSRKGLKLTPIYFFPTDSDIRDFSRDRFEKALQNPYLNSILTDKSITRKGEGVVQQKRIGMNMLYFRGMQRGTRVKAVDGDFLVFDELEECDEGMIAQAERRTRHSKHPRRLYFSNPVKKHEGIDYYFSGPIDHPERGSDHHFWHLDCDCDGGCCMELTFPRCLERQVDGTVKRICPECGKELDSQKGRWIPHNPGAKMRGYQFSALWSSRVSPNDILDEYESGINQQELWNHDIGLPYSGESVTFRADWYKVYDPDKTAEFLELDTLNIFAAVDPAVGESGDLGDETAIGVIGVDRMHRIFVLEMIHGIWTPLETADKCLEINDKWRPTQFGFEEFAYQAALKYIVELQRMRPKDGKIHAKFPYHALKRDTGRNKDARIKILQGPLQNSEIFFGPMMGDMQYQLLAYKPGGGKKGITGRKYRDDMVDVLAYLVGMAYAPRPEAQRKDLDRTWNPKWGKIAITDEGKWLKNYFAGLKKPANKRRDRSWERM